MANEQTSVPLYAALEVLTAASMNISAGTGVPVFATTVTRDAAFGGANEKTLAEGQLCYLSASNIVQYYDGAAWATVGPAAAGGLVRVGGGTVGTGASVAYASVFSSTYSSYYVIGSNLDCSSVTTFTFILTGIISGYYTNRIIQQFNNGASTASLVANNAATSGAIGRVNTTQGAMFSLILTNPNVAQLKTWTSTASEPASDGFYITAGGFINSSTQATGFTFNLDSGVLAGGRFDIYGYNES